MDAVAKKTVGNPNFGKPFTASKKVDIDHAKMYEFELIGTHELYKPVDEKGMKVSNPYPPYVMMPNQGVAYDEEKNTQRAWRFIATEKSIWRDEQQEYKKEEEANILSLSENLLEFVNGKCSVSGKMENKVRALLVQDICEDKKNKLKPTQNLYRLNNPDDMLKNSLTALDREYEAMKLAQEASKEDMVAYAYVLGVNVEADDKSIRRDFLMKAKTNPEFFLKNFTAEKNKYAYLFFRAFTNNIISSTYGKNKLTWVGSNEVIMDCKSDFNVVEELCVKAANGDKPTLQLYEQLKTMNN